MFSSFPKTNCVDFWLNFLVFTYDRVKAKTQLNSDYINYITGKQMVYVSEFSNSQHKNIIHRLHRFSRFFSLIRFKSPASHFDLVAQFLQSVGDLLAVFALDFDHAVFDRAAAAAGLLELFRQRGQIPI